MKLHVPKMIWMAVMAAQSFSLAMADAQHMSNEMRKYTTEHLILDGDLTLSNGEDKGFLEVRWETPSTTAELTGSGTITTDGSSWEFGMNYSDLPQPITRTIGEGITLEKASVYFRATPESRLEILGSLKESDVYAAIGTVDIRKANIDEHTAFEIGRTATLIVDTLEIKENNYLLVCTPSDNTTAHANLKGNLVLNGRLPAFTTEQRLEFNYGGVWMNPVLRSYGMMIFWGGSDEDAYTTLNIQGSLTIKSDTGVLFANEGDHGMGEKDGQIVSIWKSDYRVPDTDELLFICNQVDEASLERLKPFAFCEDTWSTGGYEFVKPITGREFYARSGTDGKVYIYLGMGGEAGVTPPAPELVVKPGDKIVLSGSNMPTLQTPVQLQGGVADASSLPASLLNNQVIQGSGGTLQTASNQTMHLTGDGKVQYSIAGTEGNTHGADIEIETGSNLSLSGTSYAARTVTVKKGSVTISGNTTLGTGAAGDMLDLSCEDTHATNFGHIAADVTLGKKSTLLNESGILGDVSVGGAATMVNNGDIAGRVLVEKDGKVYGSGSFADTVIFAGAYLHVGNSPGYQKHTSLTIDRGASLSFSVDGPVAATAANKGNGTHSVLEAGTLTINPGTGTVTVNVDVTMGIVAAGSEPLSLTLIDAGTTNAQESDFKLKLSDENQLLEEGASLSFDATEGTLVLNGVVSKAALAALMDSNSANVANTMWASANAVQEMARTAEHQFLVGMPGQTTFWGAAMGSFMDVSGKQGFTSNMGGYVVGLQHAFTKAFRAGVAFGQSFGDFKSDDNQLKADQMALMPTLTAQYVTPLNKTSSLMVSGHIAYGVVENEADTYQAGTKGNAEWDDQVLNISIRAAWNSELTDNTTVSLFTGLTYQNVEQDSFTEKFTGGERDYRSGSLSSLSIPVGVTLRGIYQMEGTNVFAPEVTLAYTGDIARDNPEVKTSAYGLNREGKGTNIGRSAFMLNAGANWMFDSTWSVGAFYTLEARSKQVNQSVNAALRCSF